MSSVTPLHRRTQLSESEARHLYEHGYVKLTGAIEPEQALRARRRINSSLADGMDPAQMQRYRAQSYCPEIQASPEILDLYNESEIAPIMHWALAGEECPVESGQVGLRFPSAAVEPRPLNRPHIDGTYSPANGVTQGELSSFTALCAVFLSDLPDDNCGNFTVWPGAHEKVSLYARQHGWEALIAGLPPIDLPPPLQITAKTGDVVIAHYLLPHTVGPHAGPDIRYACFFRVKTRGHKSHKGESLTDPWREWPGVRGSIGPRSG